MDDATLVWLLKDFKKCRPESGLRYVIGWLRTNGLRVQKERIWLKWANIDPVEQALWHDGMREHHVYTLTRPNLVWHLDGHHKLIMYGIVIHGIINGYCHTVRPLFVFSMMF
ncbi:hypothetical protein K439DRAFT_1376654 [Ramaria rubella]|nr:hypothetical protein K439DRAFT_1376654 [Ramaria rubella]